MKVFLSYHRKDTKYRKRVIKLLKANNVSYYAVPEEISFDGHTHPQIKDEIIAKMNNCTVLLCLIGKETYQRPHIDWELHKCLKGGVGRRKGLLAVLLETRDDNKNNIDFASVPPRIADNINYAVIKQFASLHNELLDALIEAEKRRNDNKFTVNNTRKPMQLSSKLYFDN